MSDEKHDDKPGEKPTAKVDQFDVFRGMLQRSIDVGEAAKAAADAARAEASAARAEGEVRGLRQDRAIQMVSDQVRVLGGVVEKHDKAIKDLQGERAGIKKHVSMTEDQTAAALAEAAAATAAVDGAKSHVALLEGDIEDIRSATKANTVALQAVTTTLGVVVPRPDGSMPPSEGKKKKNEIERQSLRQTATLWLVAFVVAAGGLKEFGFWDAVKELFFSHH